MTNKGLGRLYTNCYVALADRSKFIESRAHTDAIPRRKTLCTAKNFAEAAPRFRRLNETS
ncbi:MAG: hypothetical protein BGO25_04425 [Acidobacteriales bacterium 59-55]|nr:MAG: hypothetical protein BGO25_04425 [Acidobacteriales bacterium 59-55]